MNLNWNQPDSILFSLSSHLILFHYFHFFHHIIGKHNHAYLFVLLILCSHSSTAVTHCCARLISPFYKEWHQSPIKLGQAVCPCKASNPWPQLLARQSKGLNYYGGKACRLVALRLWLQVKAFVWLGPMWYSYTPVGCHNPWVWRQPQVAGPTRSHRMGLYVMVIPMGLTMRVTKPFGLHYSMGWHYLIDPLMYRAHYHDWNRSAT